MRLPLIIGEGKRRAPPHTDGTKTLGFRLQSQLFSADSLIVSSSSLTGRHSGEVNGQIRALRTVSVSLIELNVKH